MVGKVLIMLLVTALAAWMAYIGGKDHIASFASSIATMVSVASVAIFLPEILLAIRQRHE